MRLVNGLAGPIRPPALQGLAIPKGIDLPAAPRGPAGPAGPVPAPPGAAGLPPPPVALPPQRAAPYPPPGAPAAPVGAMAGGAGPLFPPLSPEQANAFQTAFTQLDTDRDGWVQVRGWALGEDPPAGCSDAAGMLCFRRLGTACRDAQLEAFLAARAAV